MISTLLSWRFGRLGGDSADDDKGIWVTYRVTLNLMFMVKVNSPSTPIAFRAKSKVSII